jgi:uncharacterized membrane protein YfcA
LVVLGNKVTKILYNSFFFFFSFCLVCLALQTGKHRKENQATKVMKKPKKKLPKYVMSKAFSAVFSGGAGGARAPPEFWGS